MELKQNNMTGNYFSEEYLMNTVSRFWKNFVAEEFSYENAIAAALENPIVKIPASGKRNYKDLELLHIVTLGNAVYLSLQNDLSFVADFDLWFFEHQSTLKLSSAYRNKEAAPQLELQVQVININLGFNSELMNACQILKEYAQFVAEVREQTKVHPNRQAIVQAVDVCIKKDILKEFLLENKKEVIDMVFFEYDAEAEKRVIYKDGKAEEIVRLCKKFHVSKEDTIRELETELSISTQAAMDYYNNFTKTQVIM